jgi:hypothetical protein
MFVSNVGDMSNTPGNKSNSVNSDRHHAVIQEHDADNNDDEDDEEPGFWDDHGHARLERKRRLAMSGSVKAQEAMRNVKGAKTIQQEVYIYPNDRPLTNSEIFQAFLGIPMSNCDKAQAALMSKIHCE